MTVLIKNTKMLKGFDPYDILGVETSATIE